MTAPIALSTITWYFSIDCDHDLSGTVLKFHTDPDLVSASGNNGTPLGINPPALIRNTPPAVKTGFARYWWSILLGPAQPAGIRPPPGISTIYAQLVDTPNTPVYSWRITIPN